VRRYVGGVVGHGAAASSHHFAQVHFNYEFPDRNGRVGCVAGADATERSGEDRESMGQKIVQGGQR